MKNLVLASTALAAFVMTACDSGSAVTECTTDADCPTDQPVCDTSTDPGICVPEGSGDAECEEDLDCQLANPNSGTGAENCDDDGDCPGGETCVKDSLDVTYCAVIFTNDTGCDETFVTVQNAEGDDVGVCLADGSCNADGECE